MQTKHLLITLICLLQMGTLLAEGGSTIIPKPIKTEITTGSLDLNSPLTLSTNCEDDRFVTIFDKLSEQGLIQGKTLQKKAKKRFLNIVIDTNLKGELGDEGYKLVISQGGVEIVAVDYAGLLYGTFSLLQLVEMDGRVVPCQTITDHPRFGYRGFMLDVSRHFQDSDFIKKQLDMLAYLKLNTFHWHLTDGAGWRIEIDKYPRLTSMAAWRPYETCDNWYTGGKLYCSENDPRAVGGYYTKEQVREVVEYARQRNITVIPEIEMPGHSEEVLAVYPELSCTGLPYKHGEYCIGNPKTYEFLTGVLTEVLELFPSKYIHIGGDEAGFGSWEKCEKCQKLMADRGIKSNHDLQNSLIHDIEKFLNDNGRSLVGWDEIAEGTLSKSATVMSWRGTKPGLEAASKGYKVVMSPTTYCYFDYYQNAPPFEPEAMGAPLTLEKVYSYCPVPDSLKGSDMILGVQANLWTEHVPTEKHTEYMMYPRLFAIAEVGWSEEQGRSYDEFRERVISLSKLMNKKGYNTFDIENQAEERMEHQLGVKHLAIGKKVSYTSQYSHHYPAQGDLSLTDGVKGDWAYNDGAWQGFGVVDFDVTIDLGQVQSVKYIGAEFLQNYSAYIWMPSNVEIYGSENGVDFTLLSTIENKVDVNSRRACFATYAWEGETQLRYVRYFAKSNGRQHSWIFMDEIVVR